MQTGLETQRQGAPRLVGVLAIGPCFTVRHWSVTQATVSLSSAESEAKAITKGCIEALYVKHLLEHQTAHDPRAALDKLAGMMGYTFPDEETQKFQEYTSINQNYWDQKWAAIERLPTENPRRFPRFVVVVAISSTKSSTISMFSFRNVYFRRKEQNQFWVSKFFRRSDFRVAKLS